MRDLETLDQAQRRRRPNARPISSAGTRKERKAMRAREATAIRDVVWARDDHRSRASWRFLYRTHVDPDRRGEVAHLKTRSAHPELTRATTNQILLSATEHKLADPRTADAAGKALLEIKGSDANKKLTFTMHDRKGHVLWTRESWPAKPPTKERVE